MQITFSEKELEDFLCKDDNLMTYLKLKFIARQVRLGSDGIIDILAYHKSNKCFVIIELKRATLDANALLQGLNYLNFYQKTSKDITNYTTFQRSRKFCLLLIGSDLDPCLHKIVSHGDDDYQDGGLTYTLFNMNLDSGINFKYYNKNQSEFDEKLSTFRDYQESKRFRILEK
jgi:hypothetical protein